MTLTMGDTVLFAYSNTWSETDGLASLLDETLYLLEKLIQHHLSDAVEHSLTDAGYQSSHFCICTVFEHCLPLVFLEVNRYVALHEARSAGPFAAENIMRRRVFILDRNLSFVSSFDRSNANLHGRFVLIRSNFVHLLAPWHALGHDLGVEQYLPNLVPRSVKRVASFYFQRANLRLPSAATLNMWRVVGPPICGYRVKIAFADLKNNRIAGRYSAYD